AAADAGGQRHVDARPELARRAVEVLGVARGVGVVLELDRQAQGALERLDQRGVDHAGDVGGEDDPSALVVQGPRRAHAHPRHLVPAADELARGAGHRRHHGVEPRLWRVDAHAVEDAAVLDHCRQDLRAAEVYAQCAPLALPPARRAASTACAAIKTSSSVCTTSTATGLPGSLITGPPAAFAASSNLTPRNPRPSSAAARVAASFCPTPPVNTTASRPPIAAAYAPTSLRTR